MKKIVSVWAALCCAFSVCAATQFTFSSSADLNQTKDGFTIAIAQGTGGTAPVFQNPFYNAEYHPEMRLYSGNTVTVTGDKLTDIQMVFAKSGASNKQYTGLSASVGELVSGGESESATDWKVDHWTGDATSVVFTLTGKGQRQLQQILIDGEPIEIKPEEEILPTEEDLDPAYSYAEPTDVSPKDTTIIKKEYAFIHNNILVHCTQGSILKAEDDTDPREEVDNSHPAYFNCNADYQLTFTATQPIKGVAIDGFVRKKFEATCDHGTIQFLTDPDADMEGYPALVLLDVNSTSVTLNCPKQLRCYGVHVYFTENPEPLFSGIDNVQSDKVQCTKVIENGVLYLMYKGTKYNALGAQL